MMSVKGFYFWSKALKVLSVSFSGFKGLCHEQLLVLDCRGRFDAGEHGVSSTRYKHGQGFSNGLTDILHVFFLFFFGLGENSVFNR